MTEPRIVPEITALTEPYWSAAREGTVLLQRCDACAHVWHPPQPTCPACRSQTWQWRAATPTGEVHSYTVVRHAGHRAVADELPYIVALVRLADGPLLLCNVLGCEPEEVHVGMPVAFRRGPTPGGDDLAQAWAGPPVSTDEPSAAAHRSTDHPPATT